MVPFQNIAHFLNPMLFKLFITLIFISKYSSGFKRQIGYRKENLCHLKERAELGLISTDESRGHFECGNLCMNDQFCHGFSVTLKDYHDIKQSLKSVDENIPCHLHKEYFNSEECVGNVVAKDHVYFAKEALCHNGGLWDNELRRCLCPKSRDMSAHVYGKFCNSPARNCMDLKYGGEAELSKEITFPIFPGPGNFEVVCIINGEHGVVRAKISKLAFSNNRFYFNTTLSEYENGFRKSGHPPYGHWLGMKAIRSLLITSPRNRELLIGIIYWRIDDWPQGEVGVKDVRISPPQDGYRLTFDPQSHYSNGILDGMVQFCFMKANGMRFSTFDEDGDGNETENCAALNGVGWWFNGCHPPCNAFGVTPSPPYVYKPERFRLGKIYPQDDFATKTGNVELFIGF